MKLNRPSAAAGLAIGAIAGLTGTAVLMAMRSFDERYSPKTLPKMREDPGEFIENHIERSTGLKGKIPNPLHNAGAMLVRVGYGTMAGALYGAVHRRRQNSSAILNGGLFGLALYAVGYLGWLPILRLSRPAWKHPFPQIAGEALRHVGYGVTTAAVYQAIHAHRPANGASFPTADQRPS